MIQAGIVTEDDLVALLDGCLVTTGAPNRPHSLAALLPSGWYVDGQEPLTLLPRIIDGVVQARDAALAEAVPPPAQLWR